LEKNLNFLEKKLNFDLRKTQKPKNPNFLKKMDPEKPRKTQ